MGIPPDAGRPASAESAAGAGDRAVALGRLRPGMVIPLPLTACGADRVLAYADLMDAHHPIHVDEEFARTSRFGRRIAHGPLALGLALAGLGEVLGPALVALLEIRRWTFLRPVFVGAALRTEACVLRVDRAGGESGRIVEVEIRLLGDDGSLLQRGEAQLLVGRPPGPDPEGVRAHEHEAVASEGSPAQHRRGRVSPGL